MDAPRLTIFSTPIIATWVLDETHHVLFDAGDGVAALLEGKIHKARLVALTHAHRDHIGGLPQLLNLRGGAAAANGEPLRVVYPEGSGALHAFSRFLAQFDPATAGQTQWQSMTPEARVWLDERRFLQALETHHIPSTGLPRHRTLGYRIGRVVERLRPELRGLPQNELDKRRAEGGREAITITEEETILTVSGDTRPLSAAGIAGTRFLLHECTFLDSDTEPCSGTDERGHEHSCLTEILDLAAEANVSHLGLYHISRRYTDDDILRAVRTACARRELRAKVSVALPGRLYTDFFSQTLWPGKS